LFSESKTQAAAGIDAMYLFGLGGLNAEVEWVEMYDE
jgi:hypothetical protein